MRTLNLVTAVSSSGYGTVGLNLLKALDRAGCEVALFPADGGAFRDLHLSLPEVMLVRAGMRRRTMFPLDAPCLRITPEFDMTLFAGHGPRAGLPFFETDAFTPAEMHHLGGLDHLLLPSHWAKEVVEASSLRGPRVAVVPLGVDREVFSEAGGGQGRETVFLHVGKWERRKGQDVLLEAFSRAFEPKEPVRLELMCDNPLLGTRNQEWVAQCRRSPMAERIRMLPRVATAREVAARMQSADCGVYPARAEGWNLELLEMMSCGKTVIATDYSGHTAFATPDNCRLIEVERLEPAVDERFHQIYGRSKIGRWAHLGNAQLSQLIEHLRAVHRQKQEGRSLANPAGVETASAHSWARSAAAILEALGVCGP